MAYKIRKSLLTFSFHVAKRIFHVVKYSFQSVKWPFHDMKWKSKQVHLWFIRCFSYFCIGYNNQEKTASSASSASKKLIMHTLILSWVMQSRPKLCVLRTPPIGWKASLRLSVSAFFIIEVFRWIVTIPPSLLVKRCIVNIFLQLGGVKCLTYDYICNPNDGIEYGQQQSDHERTEKT